MKNYISIRYTKWSLCGGNGVCFCASASPSHGKMVGPAAASAAPAAEAEAVNGELKKAQDTATSVVIGMLIADDEATGA